MSEDSANSDRRRDLLRIWTPALLVTLLGFVAAWRFVGPSPPDLVRIATGAPDGGYAAAGEAFAHSLRAAGIEVELVTTRGAAENLERLRAGDVDAALVQGGLARTEEPGLAGVCSLYLEPLWIFSRSPIARLDELAGKRVELGAEGSGTRILAERLFADAGVAVVARGSTLDDAREALRTGAADALVRVSAPRSPLVRELFDPTLDLRPADLERAEGITRTLTYLRPVRISAGSIDLAADLPAEDVRTVAAAAMLVANEELHPAVVARLVGAAKVAFDQRGVLEDAGEFPSLALLDVPPSLAARRAVAQGPSFLYRVLPFQVAALVDRLKILLLPLFTLLFPLFRVAPPLYRWRIRRRILLWYGRMGRLERRLREDNASPAQRSAAAAEIDRFDDEIASVKVPLGYADELYQLRLHLRMVREDIESARGRWA